MGFFGSGGFFQTLVVTWIYHTLVNVCFAMCAGKTGKTVTRVLCNVVDAYGVVLAWIGRTVVDICGAVVSCITGITKALLSRCGGVA